MSLWEQEFRPKNLNDLILPDSYKKSFSKYIEDGEIPHLFLHSNSPGSGKTSTAKMFVNELNAESIFINGSSECGIGTLRTKITHFVGTTPFLEEYKCKHKIVIYDEFDGVTANLQEALRGFMDEYSDNVRFILTANNPTKIIDALKSRVIEYDYSMNDTKFKNEMLFSASERILKILKEKNIMFDVDNVYEIVKINYPDIRKIINILQRYCAYNSDVIDSGILTFKTIDNDELLDLILQKKYNSARKYYLECGVDDRTLYRFLYDRLLPTVPKEIYGRILGIINFKQYQAEQGIDREINFADCLWEIMTEL